MTPPIAAALQGSGLGTSVALVPVVVPIAAAIGYALLGAFQFSADIRRRQPGWHRGAGRVLPSSDGHAEIPDPAAAQRWPDRDEPTSRTPRAH